MEYRKIFFNIKNIVLGTYTFNDKEIFKKYIYKRNFKDDTIRLFGKLN
jgi:hypothetical protein